MSAKLERLAERLTACLKDFPEGAFTLTRAHGELRLDVAAAYYLEAARRLRDTPELAFDEMMDLCGVDYSAYGGETGENRPARRFAVVVHLLSMTQNWRLRVRVFAEEDGAPALSSVTAVWNAADWYEREAFDLFGVVFDGHADLRRILTDYGFVGHPFRKDFPLTGHVEMRYDPEQGRVIYEAATTSPREVTPRIRREAGYGAARGAGKGGAS
ncbi:MAG: NADH-quinone oxidoreductase subunit C [Zoogloeaceae bacterium]|nr:NADH-quinone oxidoreductase subunit C [Zoogloeaceae bacterium]